MRISANWTTQANPDPDEVLLTPHLTLQVKMVLLSIFNPVLFKPELIIGGDA